MSDVEAVGREAFIHWNGTPLNLMYIIAVKTLNRKYIFYYNARAVLSFLFSYIY